MKEQIGLAAYRCEEDIVQNLKDAACDETTIRAFLQSLQGGKMLEGIRLLRAHRRCWLDELHREQKRIDCLDYLLFRLQKADAGIPPL